MTLKKLIGTHEGNMKLALVAIIQLLKKGEIRSFADLDTLILKLGLFNEKTSEEAIEIILIDLLTLGYIYEPSIHNYQWANYDE